MSDMSYSALIRELARQYYNQQLERNAYRQQRRELLERIDSEYNDQQMSDPELLEQSEERQTDQSMLMRTIAFFKNRDVDE